MESAAKEVHAIRATRKQAERKQNKTTPTPAPEKPTGAPKGRKGAKNKLTQADGKNAENAGSNKKRKSDQEKGEQPEQAEYEKQRLQTMEENEAVMRALGLGKTPEVKIGKVVHIPHSAFPEYACPQGGYWKGKTVRTKHGGEDDVGVRVDGEADIFTQPKEVVATWLVT